MRIVFFINILNLLFISSFSYGDVGSSIDPINIFDEFTRTNSSVDLFSGNASYEHNMFTLNGIEGFNLNFKLRYFSNVFQNVRSKNDIAPTGWVGLGWQFGFGGVECDNLETYGIEDDVCYIEGTDGVKQRLHKLTGADDSYQLEKLPYWKVSAHRHATKGYVVYWVVTDINGTKYFYGEQNNAIRRENSQATRFTFSWKGKRKIDGHDIEYDYGHVGDGFGGSAEGFGLYPYRWDLEKVVDVYGNEVKFEYRQELEAVHGRGNWKSEDKNDGLISYEYTKESYLHKITTPEGYTVELDTLWKDAEEYYDPYIFNPEPDAFIEVFERRLLGEIKVNDSNGKLIKKFKLCYRKIGLERNGEYKKSLLEKVDEFGRDGVTKNATTKFGYIEDEKDSDDNILNYGALKTVEGPLCGRIEYSYEKKKIRTKKTTGIDDFEESSSPNKVPVVYTGLLEDGTEYAVVKPRGELRMWIYHLNPNGKWEKKHPIDFPFYDGEFSPICSPDYLSGTLCYSTDMEVKPGKGFFVVEHKITRNYYLISSEQLNTYWDIFEWNKRTNRWENKATQAKEKPANITVFDNHILITDIPGDRYQVPSRILTKESGRWREQSLEDGQRVIQAYSNHFIVKDNGVTFSGYTYDGSNWNKTFVDMENPGEFETKYIEWEMHNNYFGFHAYDEDVFLDENSIRVFNWNGWKWVRTLNRGKNYGDPYSYPEIYNMEKDYFVVRYRSHESFHAFNWNGNEWVMGLGKDMCPNGGNAIRMFSKPDYFGISYANVDEIDWWPDDIDEQARLRIYDYNRGNWTQSFDGNQNFPNTKNKRMILGMNVWSTDQNPHALYSRNPDGTSEENNFWKKEKSVKLYHNGYKSGFNRDSYFSSSDDKVKFYRRFQESFKDGIYSFVVIKEKIYEPVTGKETVINYEYQNGLGDVFDYRTGIRKNNRVDVVYPGNGKIRYKYFNYGGSKDQIGVDHLNLIDGMPYAITYFDNAGIEIKKVKAEYDINYKNEWPSSVFQIYRSKEIVEDKGILSWNLYQLNSANGQISRVISNGRDEEEILIGENVMAANAASVTNWRKEMYENNMLSQTCQSSRYILMGEKIEQQVKNNLSSKMSDELISIVDRLIVKKDFPKYKMIIDSSLMMIWKKDDAQGFVYPKKSFKYNMISPAEINSSYLTCQDPGISAEWKAENVVQSINDKGKIIKKTDSGVKTSVIYDENGLMPVVQILNADLDEVGVLTNFNTGNWSNINESNFVNAAVTIGGMHFGDITLKVSGNNPSKQITSLRQKINAQGEKQISEHYLFSVWVQPKDDATEIKLEVLENGTKEVDESAVYSGPLAKNKWQKIERLIDKSKFSKNLSSLTIKISSDGGDDFYFEDMRFHPISAKIESKYYESGWKNITASAGASGYGEYHEFDDFDRISKVFVDDKNTSRVLNKEFEYNLFSCAENSLSKSITIEFFKNIKWRKFLPPIKEIFHFSNNNDEMTVSVANTMDKIKLKSVPESDDALVALGGEFCNCSGERTDLVPLMKGVNNLSYRVQSPDGTANIYKLLINRTSNCWIYSGNSGISTGQSYGSSLAFYDNSPFVGFVDNGELEKAYVAKLINEEWVKLGGNISEGSVKDMTVAVSSEDGMPFATFIDNGIQDGLAVAKKYDGIAWNGYGGGGNISEHSVVKMDMAYKNGVSYAAYVELNDEGDGIQTENDLYMLYVKKLVSPDVGWVSVGNGPVYEGKVMSLSIDVSENGVPYVALMTNTSHFNDCPEDDNTCSETPFQKNEMDGSVITYKLNGAIWEIVGDVISNRLVYSVNHPVKIRVFGGTPYIAYTDKYLLDENGQRVFQITDDDQVLTNEVDYTLHVKKFEEEEVYRPPYTSEGYESHWIPISDVGSSEYPGIIKMKEDDVFSFDLTGSTPTIAFENYQNSGRISVIEFDGAQWSSVGNPAFIESVAENNKNNFNLKVTGFKRYLSIMDGNNAGKLSVLEYEADCHNATLSSLSVSTEGNPVEYVWGFKPYILQYIASVESYVTSIEIGASTSSQEASYKIRFKNEENPAQIQLNEGKNFIQVIVTAGDGVTELGYFVTITRKSAVAPLSEVTLKMYDLSFSEVALSPQFTYNVQSYTANVPNSTTSIMFLPKFDGTQYEALQYNEEYLIDGIFSEEFPLNVGENVFVLCFYDSQTDDYLDYSFSINRSNIPDGVPFWSNDIELPLSQGLNELNSPDELESLTINLLQNGTNSFEINGVFVAAISYEYALLEGINFINIQVNDGQLRSYNYLIAKKMTDLPARITAKANDNSDVSIVPKITDLVEESYISYIDPAVTSITLDLWFDVGSVIYIGDNNITTSTVVIETLKEETEINIRVYKDGEIKDYKVIFTKNNFYRSPKEIIIGSYEFGEKALSGFYKFKNISDAYTKTQLDVSATPIQNISLQGFIFYIIPNSGKTEIIPPEFDLFPFNKGVINYPLTLIGISKGSTKYLELEARFREGTVN